MTPRQMDTTEYYTTATVKTIAICIYLRHTSNSIMHEPTCTTVEVLIHMTTLENSLLLSHIVGNIINIVECLLCPSYFPNCTNMNSFYL